MSVDLDRPMFTTRDVADILGVSTQYVRLQVRDGRLHATVARKRNHRTLYRFSLRDVRSYDPAAGARLEESAA